MEKQAQYETHADLMERLQEPFDESLMEWKPERGNELPYFHWTVYQQRLDRVCGMNWTADFVNHGDGQIECEVSIKFPCGTVVRRSDVGEDEEITIKATGEVRRIFGTGRAQAFKRAAVAFGVGRYVYQMKPRKKGQRPPQRAQQTPAQQAPPPQQEAPPPAQNGNGKVQGGSAGWLGDEDAPRADGALLAEIQRLGAQVSGEGPWMHEGIAEKSAEWASGKRVAAIHELNQHEALKLMRELKARNVKEEEPNA